MGANPDVRVLLTTFSETLVHTLRTELRRLIGNEPRLGERLEVHVIEVIGRRLYKMHFNRPRIASRDVIRQLLAEAAVEVPGQKSNPRFLLTSVRRSLTPGSWRAGRRTGTSGGWAERLACWVRNCPKIRVQVSFRTPPGPGAFKRISSGSIQRPLDMKRLNIIPLDNINR